MSHATTTAQRELFRIQARLNRVIGFSKPAFYRLSIAHAKRLGLAKDAAFYAGVLARELATTPQARAIAESAMVGAMMLSPNDEVRETAREQLRGFVACAA